MDQWPVACREIAALVGELYAVEHLVPGPFPGDAARRCCGKQLRQERSRPVLDRMWHWATVQVGLPRSDFGKAVRYILERWDGLTRFVDDPRIPLDNNGRTGPPWPPGWDARIIADRARCGDSGGGAVYTLCETARLVGVDPQAHPLHAVHAAIPAWHGNVSETLITTAA